jgi:delta 1-pyrroline-5-carboxylate dehydrogenase|tara:strand:- start:232 stop:1023 length:792 start_codon:yes stop_codon:yes gene_type:complete
MHCIPAQITPETEPPQSPQALAPISSWLKAVFAALFEEDACALRLALQEPCFDRTTTVRNYVYDGKLKLFLGDTLLDVAHRNRSPTELKDILRSVGCKAHNKVAVEVQEKQVESEVRRRLVQIHGEDAVLVQQVTVPELERKLEVMHVEQEAMREKFQEETASLIERLSAAKQEHRANIEAQNEFVTALSSQVDALSETLKQKDAELARALAQKHAKDGELERAVTLLVVISTITAIAAVVVAYFLYAKEKSPSSDLYTTLKI